MLTLSPFNDFGLTIRKFSIVSLLTIYQSRYCIILCVSANICLLLSLSTILYKFICDATDLEMTAPKLSWAVNHAVTLRRSPAMIDRFHTDTSLRYYRLWRYDEMGLSVLCMLLARGGNQCIWSYRPSLVTLFMKTYRQSVNSLFICWLVICDSRVQQLTIC